MLLYTIVPPEVVLGSQDCPRSFRSFSLFGTQLIVEDAGDDGWVVTQVMSTDPADYLKPWCQPGFVIKKAPLV